MHNADTFHDFGIGLFKIDWVYRDDQTLWLFCFYYLLTNALQTSALLSMGFWYSQPKFTTL